RIPATARGEIASRQAGGGGWPASAGRRACWDVYGPGPPVAYGVVGRRGARPAGQQAVGPTLYGWARSRQTLRAIHHHPGLWQRFLAAAHVRAGKTRVLGRAGWRGAADCRAQGSWQPVATAPAPDARLFPGEIFARGQWPVENPQGLARSDRVPGKSGHERRKASAPRSKTRDPVLAGRESAGSTSRRFLIVPGGRPPSPAFAMSRSDRRGSGRERRGESDGGFPEPWP